MKESLVNKIKSVVYAGCAIFILLSLFSYSPQDTPFRTSSPNVPVQNLTGVIGAYIAEGLFMPFGLAAYFICALLFIWAVARFIENPAPKFYIKLMSSVILLCSLAVLLSLFGLSNEAGVEFGRSGLTGVLITDFLVKYFGWSGSLIIVIGLVGLSSFVATEFLVISLLKWVGSSIVGIVVKFKNRERNKPVIKKQVLKQKPKSAKEELDVEEPVSVPIERPKLKILKLKKLKKPVSVCAQAKKDTADYKFPPLDLLHDPPANPETDSKEYLEKNSRILEETLLSFGVEVSVEQANPGPTLTMYELEPAPGVQINRITALSDDIALAMKAPVVRIVAPIPGKSRVGVEVPNKKSATVYFKEILSSEDFQNAESKLTLAIGKDISGEPIVTDLGDMPHLLIAGTTGSGKTVCINSIIASLLYNASPDDLKFIMIDPKRVELMMFNGLPHLLSPVLTDVKKVSAALNWVTREMDNRYQQLAKSGVRNIDTYNQKVKEQKDSAQEKMPYLVVIIDELADLMVVAAQEVEHAITRLAQMSRAVGIHLILATQRPSVNVITGVIKANLPARIAFRVASKVDSRTVLDGNGADKLLGKGDLLFLKPGQHKFVRAQGSLIFDKELEKIVNFIKEQREPEYNQELMDVQEKKTGFSQRFERDELFDEAVKVILQTKQASVSMLQRRLGVGYTRAARLVDMMEEEGYVGSYRGSKPREILIDKVPEKVSAQDSPVDKESEETE